MNHPNIRKFKVAEVSFKFTCSIEYTAFYIFDKAASDLALQYAKKLFGRLGDVASLREGRHGLPPRRYWNYEGYVSKFDKSGRFLEGRCIDFNFTEITAPIKTETRIQRRLMLLHQQINSAYLITELRHQALQARVLVNPEYYGVCPILTRVVTLADVLLERS